VESLKIITRQASLRVAEYAFLYAKTHGRERVSAIHKANIMQKTDGLFLKVCPFYNSKHFLYGGIKAMIVISASFFFFTFCSETIFILLPFFSVVVRLLRSILRSLTRRSLLTTAV